MKRWITLLEQLYCRFEDDEVTALGAQMTYYLILSLFPFLIFLLTLVSLTPLARDEALNLLFALIPESANRTVTEIVEETVLSSSRSLMSVGMLAAVWTSSSGIMAVFRGINKAYDAEENRPFWKVRLFAIWYTLMFAVLIFLTFVMLIFGDLLVNRLAEWTAVPARYLHAWHFARHIIPFSMMIISFTLLYKQAPNYPVRLKQALPGALFSTFAWIGISLIFSYYVSNFGNFARTYGSIGGIIALLIWIYISSMIVLLGGELNAALQFMQEGKRKEGCKRFGFQLPFFGKKRKT
jgi:membrane protein